MKEEWTVRSLRNEVGEFRYLEVNKVIKRYRLV